MYFFNCLTDKRCQFVFLYLTWHVCEVFSIIYALHRIIACLEKGGAFIFYVGFGRLVALLFRSCASEFRMILLQCVFIMTSASYEKLNSVLASNNLLLTNTLHLPVQWNMPIWEKLSFVVVVIAWNLKRKL